MILNIILIFLISFFNCLVLAHGEDIPGPHGGSIRMPSNFHTEVIDNQDGSYSVYLLDINFKNPTVEKSSVSATVKLKNKKINLKCKPVDQLYFLCKNKLQLKSGELKIKAKRNGITAGTLASYDLPLIKQ